MDEQRKGRLARAAGIALLAMALPPPALADGWTLYDEGTAFRVPFRASPAEEGDSFRFDVSINGGTTRSLLMDTGSTGIIVDADTIPDRPASAGRGWVFYNSSGLLARGDLTRVPVTFVDGTDADGNPATVTATVDVLAVTDKHCLGVGANSDDCDEDNPIAMMGVGFDRNTLGFGEVDPKAPDIVSTLDGAPATPQTMNPLVNLDAMAAGTAHRGFIVTRDGLVLGLDADDTAGFSFGKLVASGDVTAGAANDWDAATMGLSVGAGSAPAAGVLLADTGFRDAFVHVPGRPTSGRVDDGERITVELLRVGDALSYAFDVGDADNPQTPTRVTWVSRRTDDAYINTGINFYDGFDYLFDAENG